MPEHEDDVVEVKEGGGGGIEGRNETVLARKLKKTLELKLEKDGDTVDALMELSTFFKVYFILEII